MRRMVVIFVLVLALGLTGCGENNGAENGEENGNVATPEEVTEIRIAHIAMANTSPQAVLNEEYQVFEELMGEMDITVEWVQTRGRDGIWPMMDELEVDFVYIPSTNFSTYITETSEFGGTDYFRLVAGSLMNNGYVLMGGPEVDAIEELDGKTVGIVNQNYMEEFLLDEQLKKVDLRVEAMGGTVAVEHTDWMHIFWEEFEAGEYDAITAWPTNMESVKQRVDGSKLLMNLSEGEIFGPRTPHVWFVARQDFIEHHPEVVKQALRAHVKLTEIGLENLDSLGERAMESYDHYFQNVIEAEQYAQYPLEYFEEVWADARPAYDPHLPFMKDLYEFMTEAGYVQGKTFDQYANLTLLNEVLAEEGLEQVRE
ncbi:ABC transporter substrate-binding protein [Dethiobacter alkaliphilus]|uniref:ABC transporter substrate-binding protein n=1 Tax=Dethiobacter alkaliphilus TaxID=427926 RepID=UPI0022279743|nr:ABC transporter substrate-binding protein [Dethiobacter alkaliphilus]MCW3491318.1 ABC transporter substrate-binding protein [Dethiobacter alkaliphilus]